MAATYQLSATGVPLAIANESLLALFNGVGSGKIVRVYRIWARNCNTGAQVAGGQNLINIQRINAATASNWTIPLKSVDTTNAAIPAQIISGCKFTVTNDALFRALPWSNDEPTIQTGTIDEIETTNWVVFWDADYNDANIEPIVLREGFGVSVQNVGLTATAPANAGSMDVFIECTVV